jgi:hypothetical protein
MDEREQIKSKREEAARARRLSPGLALSLTHLPGIYNLVETIAAKAAKLHR